MAIRYPAEIRCQKELEALKLADTYPKPQGWLLSPRMVELFILGSDQEFMTEDGEKIRIRPKYWGDRTLIQVAIATLASDRGLMLAGEPGTAKSWLSEHLSAAISGTSQLIIQGTAGTNEDQIKYTWNYAMLIAQGPTPEALVESPMMAGMKKGQLVRFEELTRCHSQIQDVMISILSEKQISIPELNTVVYAEKGFNVIATANTADKGVNEMSAALKRRFNFVIIPVLADLEQEIKVVEERTKEAVTQLGIEPEISPDLIRLMTTVFQELRRGKTLDRQIQIKKPSTVLSTAELISVMSNSALLSAYFGEGIVGMKEVVRSMFGAVSKENDADLEVIKDYVETVVRDRQEQPWQEFYQICKEQL
ncbi:ATP-binding protein [Thermoflavimicrobium dichotomicum]|uniref:AAA domain (Dynein-related subfamily) n=1 Tax=Thermoflavimicrobium dichotomicum TaxID=46223 RepID=A0A1I3LZZ0_9BACL|nr:AAA family ATPase [Thermoflavimicrobium dichotomicum]SFI90273.1 AAA domain (dynein-related subfamily) [Thermoflavimicrobium dichotomicum]